MSLIKIENFENLVKDTRTSAVVNTSKSEYTVYMNRIKAREKQGDEIRSAVKEINSLKAELREIKNLIKGLGN